MYDIDTLVNCGAEMPDPLGQIALIEIIRTDAVVNEAEKKRLHCLRVIVDPV